MFGTDARYIHSLGLFDNTMKTNLYQPDLVEAYLNLHFPIFTEHGVDLKVGTIRYLGRRGDNRSADKRFLFARLYF